MPPALEWFKSSYSGNDGLDGVEVAIAASSPSPTTVHVRDSKDRDGARLAFGGVSWSAFLGGVASAVAGEVCREARGVRCWGHLPRPSGSGGTSQGGASPAYWMYSGDATTRRGGTPGRRLGECRAGRREPAHLSGHGTS
ncbi:DUF397 domain-containing protein [Streptomyces sp. NPDC091412]|uniref:DUF397 domain-containing protein n=1 Tax=Streptomyces sp. NPDC091412 TaxID=3366002 RepID=UPI003804C2E3